MNSFHIQPFIPSTLIKYWRQEMSETWKGLSVVFLSDCMTFVDQNTHLDLFIWQAIVTYSFMNSFTQAHYKMFICISLCDESLVLCC